jgi:CheY-like chemotaxis protein
MTPGPDDIAPTDVARTPQGDVQKASSSSYVLIVDDESVVRDFLTRCLKGGGYAVKQAASAAEALDMMELQPASAVLCDIKMPGQNGLWLAERLRVRWPRTALIMVTAIDDVDTVRQSRDLGAIDYITKPIRPEHLLDVLRRATTAVNEGTLMAEHPTRPPELSAPHDNEIEAEYTLEFPVRCPACGERIASIKAVRLIRARVNFTSTLPRRGRVLACPCCLALVPAELTNF